MEVREHAPGDDGELARLIAQLRRTLDGFEDGADEADLATARQELSDSLRHGHRIFVHEAGGGRLAGFISCRNVDDVTWAESLFVDPEWRRKGVATALFDRAQELAASRGQDTLYAWVHPNNEEIIGFLGSNGYDVLNLVEVRRPHKGETPATKVRIMENEFRY